MTFRDNVLFAMPIIELMHELEYGSHGRGHGSRVVTSVAFPLILRSRVRIPGVGAFGKLHPVH